MRAQTLPIVGVRFVPSLGKTAIELSDGTTVFANGDQSNVTAILANIVVNEVGDTFVATADSKQMQADGKTPLFKKGEVVRRQKETREFKSFAGNNSAAQFAQAANAFGLQLIVQMS